VVSGASAGVLVLLALIMLVAGLFGASPLPLPGLPDLGGPATTRPDQAEPTGPEPTQSETAQPTLPAGQPALPTNANQTSPPRHVPTNTPSDRGRPTS